MIKLHQNLNKNLMKNKKEKLKPDFKTEKPRKIADKAYHLKFMDNLIEDNHSNIKL